MSPPLVALSISESPDLPRLGLGAPHLEEAMVEIARYLLLAGASLAYGGDLRRNGFTRLLFEMVRSYRRDSAEALPVANYSAWPVHRGLPDEEVAALEREFAGAGRLLWLDPEGRLLTAEERRRRLAPGPGEPVPETAAERAAGLTAMRRLMAADTSARVLLGGKVQGYSGALPGIAEEALLTLEAGKPLYALGGFGGCTRDLIHALGDSGDLEVPWPRREPAATGPGYADALRALGEHSMGSLRNGLSREENQVLFTATRPLVILRYLLRGLGNLGLLDSGEPVTAQSAL